ncbi:hypothetical protein CHARACLAT_031222, partial [Characodon lateralis]|nr:hypothetical protein [Characodon lateralis]
NVICSSELWVIYFGEVRFDAGFAEGWMWGINGAGLIALGACITSSFSVRTVRCFRSVCQSAGVMAESTKFTRCLLELPKFTVNDVRCILRASSTTPRSKLEKGFKFYVSSYLCNFEDNIT